MNFRYRIFYEVVHFELLRFATLLGYSPSIRVPALCLEFQEIPFWIIHLNLMSHITCVYYVYIDVIIFSKLLLSSLLEIATSIFSFRSRAIKPDQRSVVNIIITKLKNLMGQLAFNSFFSLSLSQSLLLYMFYLFFCFCSPDG